MESVKGSTCRKEFPVSCTRDRKFFFLHVPLGAPYNCLVKDTKLLSINGLVHFFRLLAVCWPGVQSARDSQVIACNSAKYSSIKKFTHRFSNKPFLIWLLTTPPRLKYVAKLLCNLSLMACFADINVSQGSVATYMRGAA